VEERLEQLRRVLAQSLLHAPSGDGDEDDVPLREKVLANQDLILIEAVEECKRLEEQEQRYREEIQQLASERSEVHSKLASLNLRVKAFQYRSKSLAQDDTYFKGSTLQSKLLVNDMEPAKVVKAVKEAAQSQAGFEAFQKMLEQKVDSGTMERLHLQGKVTQPFS
jgi:hypothetical protein